MDLKSGSWQYLGLSGHWCEVELFCISLSEILRSVDITYVKLVKDSKMSLSHNVFTAHLMTILQAIELSRFSHGHGRTFCAPWQCFGPTDVVPSNKPICYFRDTLPCP